LLFGVDVVGCVGGCFEIDDRGHGHPEILVDVGALEIKYMALVLIGGTDANKQIVVGDGVEEGETHGTDAIWRVGDKINRDNGARIEGICL
jgi:hypothetical protein